MDVEQRRQLGNRRSNCAAPMSLGSPYTSPPAWPGWEAQARRSCHGPSGTSLVVRASISRISETRPSRASIHRGSATAYVPERSASTRGSGSVPDSPIVVCEMVGAVRRTVAQVFTRPTGFDYHPWFCQRAGWSPPGAQHRDQATQGLKAVPQRPRRTCSTSRQVLSAEPLTAREKVDDPWAYTEDGSPPRSRATSSCS